MYITNAYLQSIQSINLKGKVKYGLKDLGKKVSDNVKDKVEKVKSVGRWVSDNLTKEEAQRFLRSIGMSINVGSLRRVSSKDGGVWKVFGGNPKDKSYYGFFLLRNGNDVRVLKQEVFSDDDTKAKDVLNWYNSVDGKYETFEHVKKERDKEVEKENKEFEKKQKEEGYEFKPSEEQYDENDFEVDWDNVIYGEDETSEEGAIKLSKDDYTIIDDDSDVIIVPKNEETTDSNTSDSDDSNVNYNEWNY